jgi:hypothetical protein
MYWDNCRPVRSLNLDSLAIEKMASGHLCSNLSKVIGWETFPKFADAFVGFVDGQILSRDDGVDIRLWTLLIDGQKLWLVFDDFPLMTSLESSDSEGDRVINEVHRKLASIS